VELRRTSGWTEQHGSVSVAFAVGFAGCLIGLVEQDSMRFWVANAVMLTALVALALDPFGGIVVGLAAAAGLIGAKRLDGRWDPDAFPLSLAETLVLIMVGVTAGLAGQALRRRPLGKEPSGTLLSPVFGSLGLLNHDLAMIRLEEEVQRATEHRRPLTVVLIDSEIIDPSLDVAATDAALRTVARVLESRLHDRDVPFAIDPGRLGAILPEASAADAWQRAGQIADALTTAQFTSRGTATRIFIADAVHVHVGLAELGPATSSADALLDAAVVGLQRARSLAEEQTAT